MLSQRDHRCKHDHRRLAGHVIRLNCACVSREMKSEKVSPLALRLKAALLLGEPP